MANINKTYRFEVFQANSTTVDFAIDSSGLAGPPTLGGQRVYPLEGRAESIAALVNVLDPNSTFTAQIADSAGRAVLVNRRAQVLTRVGSSTGTFVPRYVGRITNIRDEVSFYAVSLLDEQHVVRNADIFTTLSWPSSSNAHSTAAYAGTFILPTMVNGQYRQYSYPLWNRDLLLLWEEKGTLTNFMIDTNYFTRRAPTNTRWASVEALQLLEDDIRDDIDADSTSQLPYDSTQGNFKTLRLWVDGVDYEVHSINGSHKKPAYEILLGFNEAVGDPRDPYTAGDDFFMNVWAVEATAGVPADSTVYRSNRYSARLHMPQHPPVASMPLHIGGAEGVHPAQLLEDIYKEVGAIYSSSAIDALIDEKWYGRGWWIIREPANAAAWLEENIYRPYGWVPFVDNEGRLAPKSILLPFENDLGGTLGDLPLYTSTDTATQPAWEQGAQEIVTALSFSYVREHLRPKWPEFWDEPFSMDLIETHETQLEETSSYAVHDRIDTIGRYEHELHYAGLHEAGKPAVYFPLSTQFQLWQSEGVRRFAPAQAIAIFSRYGDGAVRGTLTPVSSATPGSSGIQPGDYIRLAVDTYPNMADQARSTGARIVQVISVTETMGGPQYETLDAGPALNPLSVPTVTLSSSPTDPRHGIVAQISSVSTDGRWDLNIAPGTDAVTPPTSGWYRWGTGASTEQKINMLASGVYWWARVRHTAPNRIASSWSTAAVQQTDALGAPSALTVDSSGQRATLSWNVGEPEYITRIRYVEAPTSSSITEDNVVALLRANASFYEITGLIQDATHAVDVAHVDGYGGASAAVSTTFETSTAGLEASAFGTISVTVGTTV